MASQKVTRDHVTFHVMRIIEPSIIRLLHCLHRFISIKTLVGRTSSSESGYLLYTSLNGCSTINSQNATMADTASPSHRLYLAKQHPSSPKRPGIYPPLSIIT